MAITRAPGTEDQTLSAGAAPAPQRRAGFSVFTDGPSAAGVARLIGNAPEQVRPRQGFGIAAPVRSGGFTAPIAAPAAPAASTARPRALTAVPVQRGFGIVANPAAPAAGPAPAPEPTGEAALEVEASGNYPDFDPESAGDDPPATPVDAAPAEPAAAPAPRRGFGLSAEAQAEFAAGALARANAAAAGVLDDEVTVRGMIEAGSIKVFNEGWGFCFIYTEDRERLKISGNGIEDLKEGLEYEVKGRMKSHSSGDSLDFRTFEPIIRPDLPSIQPFCIANFIGVGPATARKFLAKIQEDDGEVGLEALRQRLIFEPWTVAEDFQAITKRATAFGDKKARPDDPENPLPLAESPELPYVERALSTKFGSIRLLKPAIVKLMAMLLLKDAKASGDKSRPITEVATTILGQDPYRIIKDIPGYGFQTADLIGAAMSIPKNAPVRLGALASYLVIQECNDQGHTFVSEAGLKQRMIKERETVVTIDELLEHGQRAGDLTVVEDAKRGRRVYASVLYKAEQSLASDLHDLLVAEQPLLRKGFAAFEEKAIDVSNRLLGYELDGPQIKALHGLATSKQRIHMITAGPGCGKTAIMEVFCAMLGQKSFAFAAPTGKAAKVLTNRVERLGYTATTLNSLLKGSVEEGFKVNREEPLAVDVLVVDEGTMPELRMASAITAALGPRTHLVILGDPGVGGFAGQLPSIGPGRVMSDALLLEGVDHHHLTAVKRNSGGILDVVNEIRAGTLDCSDREGATFSHTLGDAHNDFPALAARYMQSVAAKGIENVVLLMSRRAGDPNTPAWNTTYANARLRDLCNPGALKVPGTVFHCNDRIIIRENLVIGKGEDEQEIRVVNGDTGTLLRYHAYADPKKKAPQSLVLKLDDGRTINFPGDSIGSLQHSYAMTVHSSQGSEYKEVLVVMTPGHSSFINQNMFLTGVSRAKEHVWIFGNDAELSKIAATPLPPRQSTLVEVTTALLEETRREEEAVAEAAARLAQGAADTPDAAEAQEPMLRVANQ